MISIYSKTNPRFGASVWKALIITLILVFCTMVTLGTPRSVRPVDEKSILNFRLVQNFGIIVPVFINGQGPYDFLLDTGTNTTVIRTELAEQLKLRAMDRLILTTVSGSQAVPRSYLESVTLGSRSVSNVEVLWQDLWAVRTLDSHISGLLGQNFLSQFNYLLSYREKRIVFETQDELKNQMSGVVVPVENSEGMIVVTARSPRHLDKSVHLVLDSGTDGLMFFTGVCDKAQLEFSKSDRSQLLQVSTDTGDTGNKGVMVGLLSELLIGNKTLFDLPAVVLGSQRRNEDGILPTSLFNRIYFNNSAKYVILDR